MKKCSYCGTEYPDDATTCGIDGQLLNLTNRQPLRAKDASKTPAIEPDSPIVLGVLSLLMMVGAFCGAVRASLIVKQGGGLLGLLMLFICVFYFTLALGLLKQRFWAWVTLRCLSVVAAAVCIFLLAFIEPPAMLIQLLIILILIIAHLCLLWYLNTPKVRRYFGMPVDESASSFKETLRCFACGTAMQPASKACPKCGWSYTADDR